MFDGLEVAMDDPGLVQRLQAGADVLACTARCRRASSGPSSSISSSVLPSMYFDARKPPPVGLAGLEHRHEVRLADLGRGARLLLEAPPEDGVLDQLEAHHLERDDRAVGLARRLEDEPHAALAEQLVEPVRAECVARLELAPGTFAHERHAREDMSACRVMSKRAPTRCLDPLGPIRVPGMLVRS